MSKNEALYYDTLKRITQFDSVEYMRKNSEKVYGLYFEEALEMAYENLIQLARLSIIGKRRPKAKAATEAR